MCAACYTKEGVIHFAETDTFLWKEGSNWYFILGEGRDKIHTFREIIAMRFNKDKNTIFILAKMYLDTVSAITVFMPEGNENYPLWDLFCWLKEHLTPKPVEEVKEDVLRELPTTTTL